VKGSRKTVKAQMAGRKMTEHVERKGERRGRKLHRADKQNKKGGAYDSATFERMMERHTVG